MYNNKKYTSINDVEIAGWPCKQFFYIFCYNFKSQSLSCYQIEFTELSLNLIIKNYLYEYHKLATLTFSYERQMT